MRKRAKTSLNLGQSRNRLLGRMSSEDRERLDPHFEAVPLAFKQTLFEQRKVVTHVYFPETGVASLVTDLDDGETVETGTVGNEGFVGVSAVLGVARSSMRAICQIPGHAWRLPERIMARERDLGTAWFQRLLRFVNFVSAMAAQSAACNRMHTVDARMSRWLLMTHDRVEDDSFPLTQQFLAQMLGVARPTVNIAGATLQRAGFITYSRGRITILDRDGLESASCECYGRIREELEETLDGHRRNRVRIR